MKHQTRSTAFGILLSCQLIGGTVVAQTPEDRLTELGITLPEMSKPIANYVKAVQTGNLLFLSGHGPCESKPEYSGKVGAGRSIEEGYKTARATAVCMLATLKAHVGELSRVRRIVKVLGMVNSAPNFSDQPKVVNGFSDLMVEVFGDRGRHARSAVGMAALPSDLTVEIELVAEIEP